MTFRTLLIDACVDRFSIGVCENGGSLGDRYLAVAFADLNAVVCELEPFERILVNRGPGSFTGIRSSLSFVSAMSLAGYPASGISVLENYGTEFNTIYPQAICIQPESKRRAAMLVGRELIDLNLDKCDIDFFKTYQNLVLTKAWKELEDIVDVEVVHLEAWPLKSLKIMAFSANLQSYSSAVTFDPLYLRQSTAQEQMQC